jgi:hypothetical protein
MHEKKAVPAVRLFRRVQRKGDLPEISGQISGKIALKSCETGSAVISERPFRFLPIPAQSRNSSKTV